jgi:hypothetical protein
MSAPAGMPRIRGKIGQITVQDWGTEEEKKLAGKWSWMLQLYAVDEKMNVTVWQTIEGAHVQKPFIFATEVEAQESLRTEMQAIVKIVQNCAGDKDALGDYFDLKTGQYVRPKAGK